MAFINIDSKRLAFLLAHGVHEGELRKFFVESRKQLILKGAKGIENIPRGQNQRLQILCEKLPEKTNDIVINWFRKNISLEFPASVSEVVTFLDIYLREDKLPSDENVKIVARSALFYLCMENPPQELTSFFKLYERHQSVPHTEEQPQSLNSLSVTKEDITCIKSFEIAELISSVLFEDDEAIERALAPFPNSLRTLVIELMHMRKGEADGQPKQLFAMAPGSLEFNLLERAQEKARRKREINLFSTGIREYVPELWENGHLEADSYEILGVCTKELENGAIFVKPMCLILDGKLHSLSETDRTAMFPESGDIMTHKTSLGRSLSPQEVIRCKVKENKGAEGRTHFRVDLELDAPTEVVRLKSSSTEPDETRELIKSLSTGVRRPVNRQFIFLLSDGLAVMSPKNTDLTRDEAYEQPWYSWNVLDTWIVENCLYILDIPIHKALPIDLSTLESAFKKVIKNLEESQGYLVSKNQKRELANLIRTVYAGEISHRAHRIVQHLDNISIDEEQLETISTLLNQKQEIKQRADILVEQQVSERLLEKEGLLSEIESLKRSKERVYKELKTIERERKKHSESVSQVVSEVFSKAIENGVETIANAEIFKVLLGKTGQVKEVVPETLNQPVLESYVSTGQLTVGDIKLQLISLGLNSRQAIALIKTSQLAIRSGICMILKGDYARHYVKVLANVENITHCFVDIEIGLSSNTPLRHIISRNKNVEGFVILNSDLSPFDAYGSALLDLMVGSITKINYQPPTIIMSCLATDLCLPLPESLQRFAITIDLNSRWSDGDRSLDEVEEESIPLLAILRSKLIEELDKLESADKELVGRVITKAFTQKNSIIGANN